MTGPLPGVGAIAAAATLGIIALLLVALYVQHRKYAIRLRGLRINEDRLLTTLRLASMIYQGLLAKKLKQHAKNVFHESKR